MATLRLVIAAAIGIAAVAGWAVTDHVSGPPLLHVEAGGQRAVAWTEIKWPFPPDPFGPGRAFRCSASECGSQIDLYLRAKVGLCGCVENIDDDLVERMSDLDLLGGETAAIGPGRPITVLQMRGRSRGYKMMKGGAAALAIAFHDRCDMVSATVAIRGDEPHAHETVIIAFLNSDLVRRWAERTLGL